MVRTGQAKDWRGGGGGIVYSVPRHAGIDGNAQRRLEIGEANGGRSKRDVGQALKELSARLVCIK